MKANFKIEDDEDMPEEKPEKQEKVKKNKKSTQDVVVNFEDQKSIEFILMDLKSLDEINKFKNMTSLSLIQQNIKSIEVY